MIISFSSYTFLEATWLKGAAARHIIEGSPAQYKRAEHPPHYRFLFFLWNWLAPFRGFAFFFALGLTPRAAASRRSFSFLASFAGFLVVSLRAEEEERFKG